ncbi:hypothetical protein K402DRAFT_328310 [Aulographum hederae CBS 113979]|uniref:Uncharacterized protein n=1 Tax=Aulographum hederae CBS 113979 TaxID=1176131 RepID=A0A6G1H6E2_9PEZI|nr:hypothetical protein K402DRAFT_328310 [Aulographum hederae CBS 113979]
MGTTISKGVLTPLSIVSIVVGFVSFAFTIFTFLNVFWNSLMTIYSAPSQIQDFLGNLKSGLYEERRHLRRLRKRRKRRRSESRRGEKERGVEVNGREGLEEGELEWDAGFRVSRDTVKHMISRFKKLEEPFLEDYDREQKRRRGGRDEWDDVFRSSSRGRDRPMNEEEEEAEFYLTSYRRCGLRERWIWLRKKPDVMDLLNGLQRVETRRVAKEIGDMYLGFSELRRRAERMDESVAALEDRLSRVVGVRRIE